MGSKERNTKMKFEDEALRLFAKRGYESVTVAEIAANVGCTPPALYKHYKSKRDLFDKVIEASNSGFEKRMKDMGIDFGKRPELAEQYLSMTADDIWQMVKNIFTNVLHDEYPALFRKMMAVEQYNMPELAELYNQRYVTSHYRRFYTLFKFYIEQGRIKQGDPEVLAVMFVSPLTVMMELCDRTPDKEQWALEVLEKHVKEFLGNYLDK